MGVGPSYEEMATIKLIPIGRTFSRDPKSIMPREVENYCTLQRLIARIRRARKLEANTFSGNIVIPGLKHLPERGRIDELIGEAVNDIARKLTE
jgi:hypothetical protein